MLLTAGLEDLLMVSSVWVEETVRRARLSANVLDWVPVRVLAPVPDLHGPPQTLLLVLAACFVSVSEDEPWTQLELLNSLGQMFSP